VGTYLDLLKQNQAKSSDLNAQRFQEYQQRLQAEEAKKQDIANSIIPRDSEEKPYSLKSLSGTNTKSYEGQPSATSRSIDQQSKPSMTSQQQQKPSATSSITSGLAGVGANSLLGGGSSAAAGTEVGGMSIGSGGGMSMAGSSAAAAPEASAWAVQPEIVGAAPYLSNIYEGGGKDIMRGRGTSRDYLNTFLDVNPVTAPINMGLRAVGLDSVGKMVFGNGGKNSDQRTRDSVRSNLQKGGLLDDAYNLTLADGSKYDLGKDGSIKNYNIDPEGTPYTHDVIDWTNPIGLILGNGDKKIQSDFTGYFSNAAISNAKDAASAKANVQAFYNQVGMTKDQWTSKINELKDAGKINQQEADVYISKLNQFDFATDGSNGKGSSFNYGGGGNVTINVPKQKQQIQAPPGSQVDFSLLSLAQGGNDRPRGDVIFDNALKGILGK
jgi:hypothetical protein